MTKTITLADGRYGEAMTLTTSIFGNEPLRLGVPLSMQAEVEAAAKGDPAAQTSLAQWALSGRAREIFGNAPMLALAECLALFAAINGGKDERELYARVIAEQAEAFEGDPINRRACLWQLASIYEDLADAGEVSRILGLLSSEGDEQAAAVLSSQSDKKGGQ